MKVSLETLFTSADFFGCTTATVVQRAKCRIIDGISLHEREYPVDIKKQPLDGPPSVLAENSLVQELIGGKAAADSLPVGTPSEMLDISAIRIGKSLFAAALLFWMFLRADLTGTVKSDIVRIFVVGLKIDGTDAVLQHLVTNVIDKPALRSFLVDKPSEITLGNVKRSGLALRRPYDRRVIEVRAIPLDKGGGSAVSVYCAGVIVDEYPRMVGADDGVKNIEHFREAVLGRILPGALFFATGSPWQPYGPAYDNVNKFFGKPTQDLVVLRTSARSFIGIAPQWTEKLRAKLERSSPLAYRTDFLAEFADGEEAVFPATAIEEAWNLPRDPDAQYGRADIFADPSALRHDYWAAMVGGWVYPGQSVVDLYEVEEMGDYITPGRGQVVVGRSGWVRILEDEHGRPIPKKEVVQRRPWFEVYEVISWDKNSGARGLDLVKAVGNLGRAYQCRDFHSDVYEQLMLGALIRQEGLRPVIHSWTPAKKTAAIDHLRTLFVERRIKLSPHEKMKQELVRFRRRLSPGGNFQYVAAGGDGHGDHASCLTIASHADLEGFIDRSPTKISSRRHEVLDYDDQSDLG